MIRKGTRSCNFDYSYEFLIRTQFILKSCLLLWINEMKIVCIEVVKKGSGEYE